MEQERKRSIPLVPLVLDGIGSVLAGLGLAKQVADIDIIPAQLRFDQYGLVLIVVGVLLMVPLIAHLIKTARAQG